VRRAEEEARRQIQEEHPDVAPDMFEIKVSEKVKEDEEKRRKLDVAARAAINGRVHAHLAGAVPPGAVPLAMPPVLPIPQG